MTPCRVDADAPQEVLDLPEVHDEDERAGQLAVNLPAVVAEVEAIFGRYERALVANDLAVLDELFWQSPHTERVAFGVRQHGFAEVQAARRALVRQSGPRRLVDTVIVTLGTSLAMVTTSFVPDDDPGAVGLQSQTWVRMPEGWRVTAAHVSWGPRTASTS